MADLMTSAAFADGLAAFAARFQTPLEQSLDTAIADVLREPLHYALTGRGKRLRPALVFLAAGSINKQMWPDLDQPGWKSLIPAAISVELIHLYSLIHDDLPCMDDDAMRHGRPTLHCAYDQATAVLCGDALQTLAFAQLSHNEISPTLTAAWLQTLSHAAGGRGMVGGQALDLAMEGQKTTQLDALSQLHEQKTGALISASLVMGAQWAYANATIVDSMRAFGLAAGRAFQIQDDILDATASSETLGKTAGKDQQAEKCSYVTLLGLDDARAQLDETARQAHAHLAALQTQNVNTQALHACLDFMIQRAR